MRKMKTMPFRSLGDGNDFIQTKYFQRMMNYNN